MSLIWFTQRAQESCCCFVHLQPWKMEQLFLTSLLFFPEAPQKQWHDICHRTVGCFAVGSPTRLKLWQIVSDAQAAARPSCRKMNANARNDRFCMSVLRWTYVEMNKQSNSQTDKKCLYWISNSCNWIFLGRKKKKFQYPQTRVSPWLKEDHVAATFQSTIHALVFGFSM